LGGSTRKTTEKGSLGRAGLGRGPIGRNLGATTSGENENVEFKGGAATKILLLSLGKLPIGMNNKKKTTEGESRGEENYISPLEPLISEGRGGQTWGTGPFLAKRETERKRQR